MAPAGAFWVDYGLPRCHAGNLVYPDPRAPQTFGV